MELRTDTTRQEVFVNERQRKLNRRRRRRKKAVWEQAAPIRAMEHRAFEARKHGRNLLATPPPRSYLWRRPSGNTNAHVERYDPAPRQRQQRIVSY